MTEFNASGEWPAISQRTQPAADWYSPLDGPRAASHRKRLPLRCVDCGPFIGPSVKRVAAVRIVTITRKSREGGLDRRLR